MKTKFHYEHDETSVCEWIDEHTDIKVIAITYEKPWYIIFYQELKSANKTIKQNMEIGDIVYLTEPTRWRKTPNGDWNEHEYPIGTPLRIIGNSGCRGLDLEFVENGIKMYECAFVKFSSKNPLENGDQ